MNNVDLYHKSNIQQKTGAKNYLKEYLDVIKWKKDSMILDIGCGDGSVTSNVIMKLVPHCKTMIGCDINEDMIKFAEKHYSSENVQFMVFDIGGKLPDSLRGNFDNALSFFVMHWVQQQQIAFQNIYDLLKKDGDLLATFVGRAAFYDGLRIMVKTKKWGSWLKDIEKFISPYHDSRDPTNELRKMLNRIGFTDVEIQYNLTSYQYESLEQIKEAIMSLVPCKIPDEMADEFLKELFIEMQRKDIEDYKYQKSTSEYVHNFYTFVLYVKK